MTIENLKSSMDKRLESKHLAKEAAKEAKKAYKPSVGKTDSKIKGFINVLQRDLDYYHPDTGAVSINLGTDIDYTGLPNFIADFLGKSEKKYQDEHVVVSAYKRDGSQHLKVSVCTKQGTDRSIDVKTDSVWFGLEESMDVIIYADSSGNIPRKVRDAYSYAIQVHDAKGHLDIGNTLVNFAIQEAARVMSPPEDRH